MSLPKRSTACEVLGGIFAYIRGWPSPSWTMAAPRRLQRPMTPHRKRSFTATVPGRFPRPLQPEDWLTAIAVNACRARLRSASCAGRIPVYLIGLHLPTRRLLQRMPPVQEERIAISGKRWTVWMKGTACR